ncbi:hypothetical protein PPSIR1_13385 [Plesiocystis pacifica SIR-1]|uniref:Uncharacterized protein n=1 Tax=Plesiocystis pacifica SIR-1 TaxID=391625 RepID=A6GEQ7_9BACT|nr:DUF2505 family protein [Plesiocystis pacifica]EDM75640.1 hypothetical protein PPSIR1_13385 [Plesiocystis pacifica SIR-1]
MRRCDVSLPVECTPARFWALYLDEDFNRDTFLHGLRWSEPRITAYRETETEILRNVAAHPKLDVSGRAARLVGESLGYEEFGRFDRATQIFHFRQRTTVFGDRLWIHGHMRADPRGEAGMHWRTQATVECSIPAVGGLLERAVEHNLLRSYPLCQRYWNQRLRAEQA